jgi:hypothetical protein
MRGWQGEVAGWPLRVGCKLGSARLAVGKIGANGAMLLGRAGMWLFLSERFYTYLPRRSACPTRCDWGHRLAPCIEQEGFGDGKT